MRLLLIRHAIAQEREEFELTGQDDRRRPLTEEGRRRMKRVARGLKTLAPVIDLLATSPLTRAAQTAAILDDAYGGLKEVEIAELAPEAAAGELLAWLGRQERRATVALVGHEPALSGFLGYLLTGEERRLQPLKKGGAALVELPTEIAAGAAELIWAIPPRVLADLAD
jgi:phosphohistidine phosphatase